MSRAIAEPPRRPRRPVLSASFTVLNVSPYVFEIGAGHAASQPAHVGNAARKVNP
jgi:hypothetical protein